MSWRFLSSRGQKQTGKHQTQRDWLLLSDSLPSLKTLSSRIDFLPHQSPRSKAMVCLAKLMCRSQGQNKGCPVPSIPFPFLGSQWVLVGVGAVTAESRQLHGASKRGTSLGIPRSKFKSWLLSLSAGSEPCLILEKLTYANRGTRKGTGI